MLRHSEVRSLSPFFHGERVGVRGSLHVLCSRREPLTRPTSLRFAGRPLLAKSGARWSKRRILDSIKTRFPLGLAIN
jgi:hypothetical protein